MLVTLSDGFAPFIGIRCAKAYQIGRMFTVLTDNNCLSLTDRWKTLCRVRSLLQASKYPF